jgi:hypothetical protein
MEEILRSEMMHGEPENVKVCQSWMTKLGQAIAETDRRLTEMSSRGIRMMHPSGRYFTDLEKSELRVSLIEQKNQLIARSQDLRRWRNERVRQAKAGEISDPNVYSTKLSVNVRNMREAAKRYGLLEDLYEAVKVYHYGMGEDEDDRPQDIDGQRYDAMIEALDALMADCGDERP